MDSAATVHISLIICIGTITSQLSKENSKHYRLNAVCRQELNVELLSFHTERSQSRELRYNLT